MLDQLVESKSHTVENTKRNGFLFGVIDVCRSCRSCWGWLQPFRTSITAWVGGHRAIDTGRAGPVRKRSRRQRPKKQPKKQLEADVRKELIQNMNQTPIKPPDKSSVVANKVKEMRDDRLT